MSLRAVQLPMRTLLSEQIGYVITMRALHSITYLNLRIIIDFQLQWAHDQYPFAHLCSKII